MTQTIRIATRGSALALAQAHSVLAQCRKAFPKLEFELKIIKTTGDKLQTASLANPKDTLPKGLFTKELEVALVKGTADLAVHSLKDLPTELPQSLTLGAVGKRADARDVLIYRDAAFLAEQAAATDLVEWTPGQAERRGFRPKTALRSFPAGTVVATSSTRRKAQLLEHHPTLKVIEIRGNVPTRLQKLAENASMDATILAAAGLERLNFRIAASGVLSGDAVPDGLLATVLEPEEMLPCVGQAAIGIEVRADDERVQPICERLNHFNTRQAVLAERSFLRAMGGGCQSPIAAYGIVLGHQIRLRALVYTSQGAFRTELMDVVQKAEDLGQRAATELLAASATGTSLNLQS